MKKLLLSLLVAGAFLSFSGGCATPAYTGGIPTLRLPDEEWTGENPNNILRIWVLENRMLMDDINSFFLVDSPSSLTRWHIR